MKTWNIHRDIKKFSLKTEASCDEHRSLPPTHPQGSIGDLAINQPLPALSSFRVCSAAKSCPCARTDGGRGVQTWLIHLNWDNSDGPYMLQIPCGPGWGCQPVLQVHLAHLILLSPTLPLVMRVSHSVMPDSLGPLWTAAHQASLSMECSRQEYWSGLPFPSPGNLSDSGIESESPAWQANSSLSEPPRKLNTPHGTLHLSVSFWRI